MFSIPGRRIVHMCAYGVLAIMVTACSSAPGSGSIDGIDLGLNTELHLKDLRAAPSPDASAFDRARGLVSSAPSHLDSLRVYSARADVDEGETVSLKIWVLPLSESDVRGMLALVTDPDGVVIRSRIWDNQDFDSDLEGAWETFWSQFEYDGSRGVIAVNHALWSADVDTLRSNLNADTTATGAITRLMYEHRLIMYDNNYLLRRSMALSGGDRVPPLDWIDANRDMYRRVGEIGIELRPIIGDSASIKYVAVAEESSEILMLVAEDAAASRGDAVVERIQAFRRRSCGACHGIKNHSAGTGKLKDALFGRMDEFGVRLDLFRVGLDVWSPPGEADRSQRMSDAVKAVLVVAGSE